MGIINWMQAILQQLQTTTLPAGIRLYSLIQLPAIHKQSTIDFSEEADNCQKVARNNVSLSENKFVTLPSIICME